jgi:hypothetical protein
MNSKVERMAELAMKLGAKNLADYGSIKSRHDFTQRQLMACLILRIYLKTTSTCRKGTLACGRCWA